MTAKTACLFWDVDTQHDFMREDGKLYVPEAESLIANLERLTRAAEALDLPVVASADDHQRSDAEISDAPDFATTYPPHCMRGTPGAERIPETQQLWTLVAGSEPLSPAELAAGLAAPRPRVLIHKHTVDVFSNPNTEAILASLDPGRIVVYGVALDVCNRYAIEGLLARGYDRVVLVTDASKPIDSQRASALLDAWRRRGVEERTTDELLAELEAYSAGSSPATA